MKIAFCYPGQGVQKTGMAQDFVLSDSRAGLMLDKASAAAELDMRALLFEENEKINITEYTQPALVTACMIMTESLLAKGVRPDIAAGLSLGEYCALTVAGAMSFEDAVRITRIRGRLMAGAVPAGEGAMAAVIGLESGVIEQAIKDIEGCYIANYNCPGQIVITGRKASVEEAMVRLTGAGARKVVPLNVSGPFHSPLLKKCGEELGKALVEISIKKPEIPYIANVTAQIVTDGKEIRPLLQKQVASPVRWEQTLLRLKESGVGLIVEIGPGKTIAGFCKKTCPETEVVSVGCVGDIDKVLEAISIKEHVS